MRYPLVIPILIFSASLSAQYRRDRPEMEVMAGAGIATVLGDIGNYGMGPAFSAGFRYRFDNNFSIKTTIHPALAIGSDAGTRNESRGLRYKTFLLEPTLQFEYFFLKERNGFDRMGRLISLPRIRPYLFGGGGGVYFNPEIEGDDLSGVTTDYSKFTWVITGGAGFVYTINKEWLLGAEFGGRFLTADYLDGYSTSASKANDLYYIATVDIIYRWESIPYRRHR